MNADKIQKAWELLEAQIIHEGIKAGTETMSTTTSAIDSQLTPANQEQMRQCKRLAPWRITWGMIDKDTREFSCYASFDKRQANKAARQGHFVVIVS